MVISKKILIIANRLDDRLRLINKTLNDTYGEVQTIFFYLTRKPQNCLKGIQDIEDELKEFVDFNNLLIVRKSDSLVRTAAAGMHLLHTHLSFLIISSKFKKNILSMLGLYVFCMIKRIKVIFVDDSNNFVHHAITLHDLFNLFSVRNLQRYYYRVHDSLLMKTGLMVYVKYPRNLIIEPTTFCNLHCSLCPTGKNMLGRPVGFMDFEKYTMFIRKQIISLTAFILTVAACSNHRYDTGSKSLYRLC